jgi:2-polyprenyl-3-methyl-5-hydroxy-6-metoxy-1,4-benzoquinol methylase
VRDAGLGTFDLVICMDVLEYVPGPCAQRQAIEKVVSSLAPGGALLISGVLQAPHVENAGWSRWLPIGARARSAQLRESLSLIEERTTERHLVSLFRAP